MSEDLNTTVNGTLPDFFLDCFNHTAKQIALTFFCCLVFIFSLAGNISVGIIVYKTKTMRKPINVLIVNMAMSDLLYAILVIPPNLSGLYFDTLLIAGRLGEVFCKLVEFMIYISASVSVQSLVLIAVDRFGAVVFPLRPPLISSKLCPFFILATWIIALGVYTPFFLGTHLVTDRLGRLTCMTLYSEYLNAVTVSSDYEFAVLIIFRCIPLVLIAILYIIIYIKLKLQKVPGERSVNANEQHGRRERNVLRMSIAIVLGFAICLMPLSIFRIVAKYVWIPRSCVFDTFELIAYSLAYLNCAINPYVCFIFSGNYRQGLKNLLSCFFAKPRNNLGQPNQIEPSPVQLTYFSSTS